MLKGIVQLLTLAAAGTAPHSPYSRQLTIANYGPVPVHAVLSAGMVDNEESCAPGNVSVAIDAAPGAQAAGSVKLDCALQPKGKAVSVTLGDGSADSAPGWFYRSHFVLPTAPDSQAQLVRPKMMRVLLAGDPLPKEVRLSRNEAGSCEPELANAWSFRWDECFDNRFRADQFGTLSLNAARRVPIIAFGLPIGSVVPTDDEGGAEHGFEADGYWYLPVEVTTVPLTFTFEAFTETLVCNDDGCSFS